MFNCGRDVRDGVPGRPRAYEATHQQQGSLKQPAIERDQIVFLRSLICTGGRWNPAACGTNWSNLKRCFAPALKAGGTLMCEMGFSGDRKNMKCLISNIHSLMHFPFIHSVSDAPIHTFSHPCIYSFIDLFTPPRAPSNTVSEREGGGGGQLQRQRARARRRRRERERERPGGEGVLIFKLSTQNRRTWMPRTTTAGHPSTFYEQIRSFT